VVLPYEVSGPNSTMLRPTQPLAIETCATKGLVVPATELFIWGVVIALPQANVKAMALDTAKAHNIFEQYDCLICSSPGIEVSKSYKIHFWHKTQKRTLRPAIGMRLQIDGVMKANRSLPSVHTSIWLPISSGKSGSVRPKASSISITAGKPQSQFGTWLLLASPFPTPQWTRISFARTVLSVRTRLLVIAALLSFVVRAYGRASTTASSTNEIPVINATGTDVGKQLNSCIAQFSPDNPGICEIAPGTYTLTSSVKKPQWVTIEGNNAVIRIGTANAPSLHSPAIVCANASATLRPTQPGTYSRRGIRNLTLIGNGPSNTPYGIWIGGDPSGGKLSDGAVPSSASDFLEEFDNVHVQNFGSQYALGVNIYQQFWVGGSIMGGYTATEHGVTIVKGGGGAENLTFTGTQFVGGGGNTGYAINAPDAIGSTINLDHVSIDFWNANNHDGCPDHIRAGQAQILFNNGHLTLDGVHMQTCSGPQIISTSSQVQITISGGTEFTFEDAAHYVTTPEIIEVAGGAPQIAIEPGTTIGIGGRQNVTTYVANTGKGGQVSIGAYYAARGGRYYQIAPYSGVWDSAITPSFSGGAVTGVSVIGSASISGGLGQQGPNQWAGKCSMAASTSCTFALATTFSNYLCFPSIDQASAPPATPISATCSLSGTTATISAGTKNSLTWDALFIGNPR